MPSREPKGDRGMKEFVDAQEMSRLHPETFEALGKEELAALRTGDSVKVGYNAERFWTVIKEIDGEKIIAAVDNVLVTTEDFKYGDQIAFEKRHVYQIYEQGTGLDAGN